MERKPYKKSDITKVILSRGRYDVISTHKILKKDTVLCVPRSEREKYTHLGLKIKCYPDNIWKLGMLRNWVLDNFKNKVIVIFDDDIDCLWVNTGVLGYAIRNPETIDDILLNTAQCCIDAGCHLFGFGQSWDVRKYKANKPFILNKWVGGVIGIVENDIRFNEENRFRVDIDYCLRNLLVYRIIWQDNRFSFRQKRLYNQGGLSKFRTEKKDDEDIQNLKNIWGKYIKITKGKYLKIQVCVER